MPNMYKERTLSSVGSGSSYPIHTANNAALSFSHCNYEHFSGTRLKVEIGDEDILIWVSDKRLTINECKRINPYEQVMQHISLIGIKEVFDLIRRKAYKDGRRDQQKDIRNTLGL